MKSMQQEFNELKEAFNNMAQTVKEELGIRGLVLVLLLWIFIRLLVEVIR